VGYQFRPPPKFFGVTDLSSAVLSFSFSVLLANSLMIKNMMKGSALFLALLLACLFFFVSGSHAAGTIPPSKSLNLI
jgi:hypothetical protein